MTHPRLDLQRGSPLTLVALIHVPALAGYGPLTLVARPTPLRASPPAPARRLRIGGDPGPALVAPAGYGPLTLVALALAPAIATYAPLTLVALALVSAIAAYTPLTSVALALVSAIAGYTPLTLPAHSTPLRAYPARLRRGAFASRGDPGPALLAPVATRTAGDVVRPVATALCVSLRLCVSALTLCVNSRR